MKKTALAASIVAAFTFSGAAPAYAQDDKAFTGPWAGAVVGYDTFTSGDDTDDSEDGVTYGIALGYDVNLGGVVLGVEGELADSSVSASATDVLQDDDMLTLSAGRDLYAGIRVGVPVSETMLLFAKAGYSNQRFAATYELDDEVESMGENLDGYRIGGGLEFDFGQPFARIEYRYSDYGAFSATDIETSRHQVMVTAGLRF
ncbi:outer membrane beta-barrel protein [Altererythrobacter salegens]|uniref:Outer membrane beta-barrel protein n=1 Tax=Croceibacterium salegens TaxID=1737568 RepID=A0A6I4T0Y5_9SPHN|nr:porin family protein [Croceibacterium salegens]MXO61259.1 outer membrane beta-barrel protein [Croceibacterium salegens]